MLRGGRGRPATSIIVATPFPSYRSQARGSPGCWMAALMMHEPVGDPGGNHRPSATSDGTHSRFLEVPGAGSGFFWADGPK